MPVGATIGAAVVGGGAAVYSAKKQSQAADRGIQAQQEGNQDAIRFQREAFNRQTALAEPFRQYGIQQANALGEIFGFDPVGQPASQNLAANVPSSFYSGARANEAMRRFLGPAGDQYGVNARGQETSAPMAFIGEDPDRMQPAINAARQADGSYTASMTGPTPEGMTNPGAAVSVLPASAANDAAQAGQSVTGPINTDRQQTSIDRFGGSLFGNALQGQLGRAATGIDANMAAAGNVYSGAREQAQANAASDLGLNAVGMYTNALLGAPNTAGAQMGANAASAFGVNSANLASANAAAQANSAYQQGQIGSQLAGNLANLGAFGLGAFGQGFGGGGGAASNPAQFNFAYPQGGTLFTG